MVPEVPRTAYHTEGSLYRGSLHRGVPVVRDRAREGAAVICISSACFERERGVYKKGFQQ